MTKGYYASKGKTYEDWHGGIHMKFKIFSAKLFQSDNRILVASIKTNIETEEYLFNFGDFATSNNQSYFKIENSILYIYRYDGTIYQEFSIVNDNRIMDEFGVLYDYKTFESVEG